MPNTQGMGSRGRFDFSVPANDPNLAPPFEAEKRTVFTPEERAELKSIIIEALIEMQARNLR